jgi:formate dehydrogenase maturation protein FdhE
MGIRSVEIIEVSSFDKIRNKLKPFLRFKDWELELYHPRVLSKKVSIDILEFQDKVQYYNDLITKKAEEIEELRKPDVEMDESNLNKRRQITKEINEIRSKIDFEIECYIESLAKMENGELKEHITELIEANIELQDYPYEEIIREIFSDLNTSLYKYNQQEYELEMDKENPTQKP